MDMIKKIVGLMFVVIGSAGFFAACNGTGATDCEEDIDCLSGEACVEQQCLALCEEDGECLDDETCEDRPDGEEGKVCMIDDTEGCFEDADCGESEVCYNDPEGSSPYCVAECEGDSDCVEGEEFCAPRDDSESSDAQICYDLAAAGESCETNADCQSDLFCDEDEDVCADTEEDIFYYTVLIGDVTDEVDPDRCDDTTHGNETAGSKIMDVILRNAEDGSVASHGFVVGFTRGDNATYGNADSILDGFAPEYSDECPDPEQVTHAGNSNEYDSNFHDGALFAMGCGGDVWVQFPIDADGGDFNPQAIDESFEIEVREFGTYCADIMVDEHGGNTPPQSGNDHYDVFLCQDGSDPVESDETCDVLLTEDEPASGITPLQVNLP